MSYLTQSGPLIWLVLLAGLVALVAAIQYARSHSDKHAALARGSQGAAMIFALLGFLIGFQKSAAYLGQLEPDKRWIIFAGLEESVGGIVVALVFAALVTVLLTVGAYQKA